METAALQTFIKFIFKKSLAVYSFSLFEKLDAPLVDGKMKCDGCKKTISFYKEGDTIQLLVGSSTLNGLKKTDKRPVAACNCSHFEFLAMGGGTFKSMEGVITPIAGFLRQFFNLEILASSIP